LRILTFVARDVKEPFIITLVIATDNGGGNGGGSASHSNDILHFAL